MENKGKVQVRLLESHSAKTLMDSKTKIYRSGFIFHTGKQKKYSFLLFYANEHHSIFQTKKPVANIKPTDKSNDFMSYLLNHLNMYHGVADYKFPLYLKEMAFKFNHQGESIRTLLIPYITALVDYR